jgi:hypothetical protein
MQSSGEANPAAPRFTITDIDKLGEEKPIPVMREGETPETAQEFYIRPNGLATSSSYTVTSNVKFYYTVSAYQAIDEASLKFEADNWLYTGEFGADEIGNFYEARKEDGYRSYAKTKLTVEVVNNRTKGHFSYYYVNGEEFIGDKKLVINFNDNPSPSEKDQVLIPAHTETTTSKEILDLTKIPLICRLL